MSNTAIVRMFMSEDGNPDAMILYPDDNSTKGKKIYCIQEVIDDFKKYFKSAKNNKSSILVEANLKKYQDGLLMSCKSALFRLDTNDDLLVEHKQDGDSKVPKILVWEKDKRNKFLEYRKTMAKYDVIDVSTSEAQCSTGIRVAKVVSVQLRSPKQHLDRIK